MPPLFSIYTLYEIVPLYLIGTSTTLKSALFKMHNGFTYLLNKTALL